VWSALMEKSAGKCFLIGGAVLAGPLLLVSGVGWAQAPRHKPAPQTVKPVSTPVLPLRAGEALDYAASFSKLNSVGAIRLAVVERRDFYGRSAWHLQAFAHTLNPLRMIFRLDDQFDSYSDASTLVCFQYELHLQERGQAMDRILRLSAGDQRAPSPPSGGATARVLPGTRDPIGMAQFLRTVDWAKVREVRAPVYDGRELYEVVARPVETGVRVLVPGGAYSTTRIELRVFERGVEVKDTHFNLWLADDARHTPVQLQAELPLGSAQLQLTRAQ
jgi:hypothetical protein